MCTYNNVVCHDVLCPYLHCQESPLEDGTAPREGPLAVAADGSVLGQCGDTKVLDHVSRQRAHRYGGHVHNVYTLMGDGSLILSLCYELL